MNNAPSETNAKKQGQIQKQINAVGLIPRAGTGLIDQLGLLVIQSIDDHNNVQVLFRPKSFFYACFV